MIGTRVAVIGGWSVTPIFALWITVVFLWRVDKTHVPGPVWQAVADALSIFRGMLDTVDTVRVSWTSTPGADLVSRVAFGHINRSVIPCPIHLAVAFSFTIQHGILDAVPAFCGLAWKAALTFHIALIG
jgi:hypothetical protein